jgi:dimethylhistidine N-methyltransferase
MRIGIVTPAPSGSHKGNRVTALRWARLLRQLGHRVLLRASWNGEDVDVLVALHALRSRSSMEAFAAAHPHRPIVLAMTGTDLYAGSLDEARRSFALATRVVVLQPLGVDALPAEVQPRARAIVQSASAAPAVAADPDTFDVCVLAHLREVKDPLSAARAVRLVRDRSRLRVLHAGAALSPSDEQAARAEERANPRYRWLGDLRRQDSLRLLRRCRALVLTSRLEGGANVVSEAIAAGVPVLSTRIPGSIGVLGEDYPGYFAVGDTAALAELLQRCERDASFMTELTARCAALAPLVYPVRERRAWRRLLAELRPASDQLVVEHIERAADGDLRGDVSAGLSATPKRLDCRYFYDEEGSLLFEAICELDEYDLLRRESALLRRHAVEIAERCPRGVDVVELGSGNAAKTRILLDVLLARAPVRYQPIDVSVTALEESVRELCADRPALRVHAIAGEYAAGLERLSAPALAPCLVLWLGSNIGNFDREQASAFLRRIGARLRSADRLLVGIDRRRPAREHERAYDDAAGVTARFNLNLLRRINDELGGELRLERFRHRAAWNATLGRVEMYLDSLEAQTVHVAALGRSFTFAAGESIHTESSYKYSLEEIAALVASAGLAIDAQWSDGRFAVNLLRAP